MYMMGVSCILHRSSLACVLCVCMHACVCVCAVPVSMSVSVSVSVFVSVCMCVYVCVCVCLCVCVYVLSVCHARLNFHFNVIKRKPASNKPNMISVCSFSALINEVVRFVSVCWFVRPSPNSRIQTLRRLVSRRRVVFNVMMLFYQGTCHPFKFFVLRSVGKL